MNEEARKIMLKSMLFQAKQTERDIIGLGKIYLILIVVGLVIYSVIMI